LSKAKIKSGQFQMADMYLETLRPKMVENWKKIGKVPMHLVRKKLTTSAVTQGIQRAKIERARYIKKNPQKVVSFDEEVSALKKRVEEQKKKGRDTAAIEMKITALVDRLKPFKGKITAKDAEGVTFEVDGLKSQLDEMEKKKLLKEGEKKVLDKAKKHVKKK